MKHTIRELNLELGYPSVDQALRWLSAELEAGKGGRSRTASRRHLEEAAAQGHITAYLPGERFSIFDETARRAMQAYPQLRLDRDLDRENRGVTFIFFRKF